MSVAAPALQVPTVPAAPASALQAVVLDAMALFWLAALVIAVVGAVRENRRADQARRRELATEADPGPTPGLDGFLDRWALWALGSAAAGLLLLGWASTMGRP